MRRAPQLPPPGEPGGQLPLFEPAPFAPSWPTRGTLADKALWRFLEGSRLTHVDFIECAGSWRLSAIVYSLRALGWPIEAQSIEAPSAENPTRTISRYRLPQRWAAQALAHLRGRR
jgi:hypothetical protein